MAVIMLDTPLQWTSHTLFNTFNIFFLPLLHYLSLTLFPFSYSVLIYLLSPSLFSFYLPPCSPSLHPPSLSFPLFQYGFSVALGPFISLSLCSGHSF